MYFSISYAVIYLIPTAQNSVTISVYKNLFLVCWYCCWCWYKDNNEYVSKVKEQLLATDNCRVCVSLALESYPSFVLYYQFHHPQRAWECVKLSSKTNLRLLLRTFHSVSSFFRDLVRPLKSWILLLYVCLPWRKTPFRLKKKLAFH